MKGNKDFFWPSYVDLMTVLFLVMLVLFVLSFKMFQDKDSENRENIARLQVEVQEKRKLDEIKAALARLDDEARDGVALPRPYRASSRCCKGQRPTDR